MKQLTFSHISHNYIILLVKKTVYTAAILKGLNKCFKLLNMTLKRHHLLYFSFIATILPPNSSNYIIL